MFGADEEVLAIARGLREQTLPKAAWTHAAHIAAAVCVLRECGGVEAAMAVLPGRIRGYNESVGGKNTDTGGYHETITRASLMAAWEAAARLPEARLADVVNTILAGPCGRSDWLLAHYTRERLFSVEARRAWVEPDLQPLPGGTLVCVDELHEVDEEIG